MVKNKVTCLSMLLILACTHAFVPCVVQESEDTAASFVMLHAPGLEVAIGSWHPAGSLFAGPSSAEKALHAHQSMVNVLRNYEIPYATVSDVLARTEHEHLIDLAAKTLEYTIEKGSNKYDHDMHIAASKKYKHDILHGLTHKELVEIIITRPTIKLASSRMNTHVVMTRTEIRPLMNIVFTRDQQITTKKGVVMGALNSPQREHEVDVMKLVWHTLNIPVLGSIRAPGKLEGGDFFPINSTLSMIGVGLRTNEEGVQQMLQRDWFGTEKVAVVIDADDLEQDRMHLDMYFNVIKHGVAIVEDLIMNAKSGSRYVRMVKEYTRNTEGKYVLTNSSVPLPVYLKQNMGWEVITVTEEDQLAFMLNFINLGNNRIVSVHEGLEKVLIRAGITDVEVKYIDYTGITTMYGAAHCSTQVFRCV